MTEIIDKLNELLMLDHDAVRAYSSAIHRISIPFVREKLTEFMTDHERHISELTSMILKLDGEPKSHPDFKGPFIQGMTAIRALMGNEQALRAMKSNEELTNRVYAGALMMALPTDVELLVRRNYQDEVRHLAWISQALIDHIFQEQDTSAHV
jgi:uncharacterized protein (TIGR02284 family)